MVIKSSEKTISASEFRRRCLELLESKEVPIGGLVITKRGRPVARLTRMGRNPNEFIGSMPGMIVDPNADLFSTGRKWEAHGDFDAESGHPHSAASGRGRS